MRTVLSDDFVPDGDSDNSQADYDSGLLVHRQERQEVHRHRRLASREYALFCRFLETQPEPEGRQLLASFRRSLLEGYYAGHCPFPPVDPVGEPLPEVPCHIHDDDESSVEDLYDEDFDADSDGGWQVKGGPSRVVGAVGVAGLGQGDADAPDAPAVYGPVVEWLNAFVAAGVGPVGST